MELKKKANDKKEQANKDCEEEMGRIEEMIKEGQKAFDAGLTLVEETVEAQRVRF